MEFLVYHLWKEMVYPKREMYPIFEECDCDSLVMTTKDFVDCPNSDDDCREGEVEEEELKFPYDSLDEDEDEDDELIEISDSCNFDMESKTYKLGQWASQHYPPPPSSKPPRLPQGSSNIGRHSPRGSPIAPLIGGASNNGSVMMRGHLVSENSRLPVPGSKGTSRAQANSSQKISPTTISSSTPSPSPSSSSSTCTTPTNELGERGSPAGSSNTEMGLSSVQKFRVPTSRNYSLAGGKPVTRSSSNSQPLERNSSSIEAGILLSPQLKRSSKFGFSSSSAGSKNRSGGLGIRRSDSLNIFSSSSHKNSPKQTFLQKKVPSVASRIKQFEPLSGRCSSFSESAESRRSSHSEIENRRSLISEGDSGRREAETRRSSLGERENRQSLHNERLNKRNDFTSERQKETEEQTSINKEHHLSSISLSLTEDKKVENDCTITITGEEGRSIEQQEEDTNTVIVTSPTQSIEQDKMTLSTTSSMEELSRYNNNNNNESPLSQVSTRSTDHRPEAIVPPHKHTPTAPPITSNHTHITHPLIYTTTRGVGPTYQKSPTQPIATLTSYSGGYSGYNSLNLLKNTPTGQQQPPLGLVTATLALAHNATANGDIVTLRKLLSSGEVDALSRDEYGSTLIHTATTYGQLASLQLLSKELSPSALLLADNNFMTPPLLAIQCGHVDCLKYLIEEMGTSLTVPEAGGETLLHHAAFHGQVKCLEYLIHRVKNSPEPVSFVDESGVTPAHFAAQRGHLDCLRLMIDSGIDVTVADHENMKPADWSDATGQHSCTQYLIMIELCWQLSRDVSVLTRNIEMLRQENNQLHELLDLRDQEHHAAIAKLHQQQQETIQKFHEQYAGITVSALLRGDDTPITTTPTMTTPTTSRVSSSPIHKPSLASKNGSGKNNSEPKEKKRVKIAPEPLTIEEIPPSSPHEVLQRQLSNVEQRLNASREMRKTKPVMATRSFSPLSPIVKRMNSIDKEGEEEEKDGRTNGKENVTSFPFEAFEGVAQQGHSSSKHVSNQQHITRVLSPKESPTHSSRQPSQRSPPQENSVHSSRQALQRSPPQENSAHRQAPQENSVHSTRQASQRSPPQESSTHSSRQPSQRSPPQDFLYFGRNPQKGSGYFSHHYQNPTGHSTGHPLAPSSHHQTPSGHHQNLTGHYQTPNSHYQTPSGHHQTPTGHHQTPTGHHQTSPSHYQTPTGHHQTSTGHHQTPAGHYQNPHYRIRNKSSDSIKSSQVHSSHSKSFRGGGGAYSNKETHPLTVAHTSPQHKPRIN